MMLLGSVATARESAGEATPWKGMATVVSGSFPRSVMLVEAVS